MSCSKMTCRNPLCKNPANVSAEGKQMPFCLMCFLEIKKHDLCTSCFGPHGRNPQDKFVCDRCFFWCKACHDKKDVPGSHPYCFHCNMQKRWEADVKAGRCTSCHTAPATDPEHKLYMCPECCDKKFPRECPECGRAKEDRRNELCSKCYFAREALAHAPKPVRTLDECAERRESDKLRVTGTPKKEKACAPKEAFPALKKVVVVVVKDDKKSDEPTPAQVWVGAPSRVRDAPAVDIQPMAQPPKPKRPQSKKVSAAEPVRVVAAAPVFPTSCWADMAEDNTLPEFTADWMPCAAASVEVTEISAKATIVVKKQH